jgi:DNA (cytosine-5)-methyltransferase 1
VRVSVSPDGHYARGLREERRDDDDLSRVRQWDRRLLTASRRTVHSASVQRRFAALFPGKRDQIGRLSRLAATLPSPTLRAGSGRDHGSFTSARPVHHVFDRVITVREAARLQSFPDWFRPNATKWHGFREVGNSVPPMLARGVAATLSVERFHPTRPVLPRGDTSLLKLSLREAAEQFGVGLEMLGPDVRRRQAPR